MIAARTIIHLDLDAFFCAVEEQRDPALRDKPFAVGGRPDSRGVVASASYMARKFGVHSAMPMSQALRRCPELLVVPPNFGPIARPCSRSWSGYMRSRHWWSRSRLTRHFSTLQRWASQARFWRHSFR